MALHEDHGSHAEELSLSDDEERELIAEAKERLEYVAEFESEFRIKFVDDLKFVYDDRGQWETRILNQRQDRPCYTYNRTEGAIDEVVGDQRQSRPAIRISAAEGGDKDMAETFTGLIRNIETKSSVGTIQDHAFTFALAGGYGVWRVDHEFTSNDAFEQDIVINEIPNPLTAYGDPAATDICKRDARYWIITETIPLEEFENEYPDVNPSDFTADDSEHIEWYSEDQVRIAEYYRKVDKPRELLQLSDGRVVFRDQVSDILDELEENDGITIAKSREVIGTVIEWFKLYGDGILEGPIEYPWKFIPVVPVYGKRINIEGKYETKGIVRNAKDPQRSYNYIRSVITEKVLLTPKFQYLLTPKQIKGFKEWWDNAHSTATPYMLYNADPSVPGGAPQVAAPNPVPVEMVQIAQMDAEDIKTATGKFDAQLGAPSAERSGIAIREKRLAGDVGTFVYIDNLTKAVRFTGEILVDMIPRIYDTERIVRVLGEDGSEDHVTLNQVVTDEETGIKQIVNDITVGKYDVNVSVGPSFQSLRDEAADKLTSIGAAFPELYAIGADVIIKNLDIPGADEIEKRLRKVMIERGVVEPTDEERAEAEEKKQGQQQRPSPVEQLTLEGMVKRIEKLDAEIDKLRAQTADIQADTQKTGVETIGEAAEIGVTSTGQVAKLDRLIPSNR